MRGRGFRSGPAPRMGVDALRRRCGDPLRSGDPFHPTDLERQRAADSGSHLGAGEAVGAQGADALAFDRAAGLPARAGPADSGRESVPVETVANHWASATVARQGE